MDDFKKAIETLEQITRAYSDQNYVRNLRTEDRSEVMDSFYSIISKTDPTINVASGTQHTVESMVAELRSRVGLDSLLNKVAEKELQISRRASPSREISEDQLESVLKEFAIKNFLQRDHGLSSVETIIEDFKNAPGGMKAIETYSRDRVRDILKRIIDTFPKDEVSQESTEAVTMSAADQVSLTTEQANIGMGGTPGLTNR